MQQSLRAVEKKPLPHMLCATNMLLHDIEDPSFVRHDNTLARPYISYGASDRVDIVLTNPPFGGKEEDGIESNFPKQFQTRETADLFLALIIRLLKPDGRAAVVLPDGSLFGEGVKTRLKEAADGGVQPAHHRAAAEQRVQALRQHRHQPALLREGRADRGHLVLRASRPRGPEGLLDDQADPHRALQACVDWWGGAKREGRVETEVAWKVTADEVKARGYNLDFKNPHAVAEDHGDPEELLSQAEEAENHSRSALRDQLKAILAEALLR